MSYVQTVSVRLSLTLSWITFQNYKDQLHKGLAIVPAVRSPWAAENKGVKWDITAKNE